MRHFWLVLSATSAFAAPPNSPYRDGANHHTGDDSFVAKFGRRPDKRDSERLRMRTHFQNVRAWLTARPPTRPELAKRRAELLSYFDDYIAKGTTPVNERLPWRTPVFIDEHDTICAVGYLIERSVGRELPERIAVDHRYDFLEDIAAAMPEVQAWVADSGMTLDELSTIQPGYIEPTADTWQRWDLTQIPDGPYERAHEDPAITTRGTFAHKRMEGTWTLRDAADKLLGSGELVHGDGAWTSYYPDGKKLAEGHYVKNDPSGAWTFFHESGNVAAIGSFRGGTRVGKWQFFYDAPIGTPIAAGRFTLGGAVTGTWRHFDASGALLATSREETPSSWAKWQMNSGAGELLSIVPGADGVQHEIHVGTKDLERYQLDVFARGGDRIYVHEWDYHTTATFDDSGHKLEKVGGTWQAADCHWSSQRKAIARSGDVARLHELLYNDVTKARKQPACGPAQAIEPARGDRIDALLASREVVRAQSPAFVRELVLGHDNTEELDAAERHKHEDLVRLIQENMSFYVEWPHVDGLFLSVFRTLPGHVVRHWFDTMDGQPRHVD